MARKITPRLFLMAALAMPFFVLPNLAVADSLGQRQTFFVNAKFDKLSRTTVNATLNYVSGHAYFYVEDTFWNGLSSFDKNNLTTGVSNLAQDFDNTIYPKETGLWGSEPNPGIDNDSRITVLMEDLAQGNGGYFDTANEVPRKDSPNSNEREMVVVNVEAPEVVARSFLAHEFQHLISYNKKNNQGIVEDIWLNELRSEYSITLVGYNLPFQGSNLSNRVNIFTQNATDSLPEWPNASADYATVNMFGEYLVEQYGPAILSETLGSPYTGINSIDQYLIRRGYKERFSDIFENWLVANYSNDISKDSRYGYSKDELKNIHISPLSSDYISYPNPGGSSFSYTQKPWQGSWHQYIVAGLPASKSIKIELTDPGVRVVYIDNLKRVGVVGYPVGYIKNPDGGGLQNFVLMPVNESKNSGFGEAEPGLPISLVIGFVDSSKTKLVDGSLIKRPGESEIYVIEGKYKRYLRPDIIKLYGHLDPSKTIELDDKTFNSYITANYVRDVNDQRIYAVWPDGTKHWLHMTGDYFTQSGRDWGSIFIINDLEFNSYKLGSDIRI